MSYLPAGDFSAEQTAALYEITPDEIRKMDADRRLELALQRDANEQAKKDAFWNALTAALPLLAFFGITRLVK